MPSVRLYITYSVYTTKLFLTRFFFWIFAYDKDVVIKFVWWYNYQGLWIGKWKEVSKMENLAEMILAGVAAEKSIKNVI